MSTPDRPPSDDEPDDRSGPPVMGAPETTEAYAAFELDDGAFVVYNTRNPQAWLQSDLTVPLDT